MRMLLSIYNFLDLFDWIMLLLLTICMVLHLCYENKNFMNGKVNHIKEFILYLLCVIWLIVAINAFEIYYNKVLWHWVHDKIDTVLFIYVLMFVHSLYVKYGGITIKELKGGKVKELKLFSKERRIKVMLLRYSSFEEKMMVIDKIVDSVTKKLIKYTNSCKNWDTFSNDRACLFVKELQEISDEAYKVMNNIGLDNKSRMAFVNIIQSMTPEFNKRIKNILRNSIYTREQRHDLVLEELEIIGNDIQREVKKLIEFMQKGAATK